MLSYQIANILLHVIFITSFLVVFFFTYTSKVEGQIVELQSKNIVKDIVGDVKLLLPDDIIEEVNTDLLPYVNAPDMKEEDEKVKEVNNALFSVVLKFIIATFAIGMLVVFIISRYSKESFGFGEIMMHNIIILFFVALTEYVFLDYFVKNYVTIDSNYIKYVIFKTLNDRLYTK
jgi:hypothetical protein